MQGTALMDRCLTPPAALRRREGRGTIQRLGLRLTRRPRWLSRLSGEAIRFGLIGASGLVVALGVINAVMLVVRAFLLANAVAFMVAASWNFFLNRRLTFAATDRPVLRQWLEFLGGSLAAAALNWAVAGALYHRFDFFYTHYNAAALIGTAAAAGANFLWARFQVFHHEPSLPMAREARHA